MKKRTLKAAFAVILICAFVLGLSSCGTAPAKLPDAESASGAIDGTAINWSYDANSDVLTINGAGAIPDSESSEKVWWHAVRHNVKEIRLSAEITAIGDYAFYYFPELVTVSLPAGVNSIGKYSFAFCSSLTSLSLPDGMVRMGEGCFEACTSLTGIFVPASVTELGARAFAHCSGLKDAVIMAQIGSVGSWTFMGCKSLEELCFSKAVAGIQVAPDAFEGASKNFASASFTESTTGEVTLTVKYVFADGTAAAPDTVEVHKRGESYSITAPAIEGHTANKLVLSGVISRDTVETVEYKANQPAPAETTAPAEETKAPEPTDEPKKITAGTIITIVIFAVVIAAIIVLAVIMIRSDKKQTKKAPASNKKNKKK